MNKKNTLVSILAALTLMPATASAAILSPDAALSRALGSAPNKVRALCGEKGWRLVHTAEKDAAYFFTSPSGGFIIAASADDAVIPLLGYSDTEITDPDNIPPALSELIEGLTSRPMRLSESDAAGRENIEPLVTAAWDQAAPYNLDCPQVSGTLCVTGCEATAAAQIMYYYKHPAQGTGTAKYGWEISGRTKTLSFNYEENPFDWDNMIDKYVEGEYTEEQAAAVANLMYGVGVGMKMLFSPYGSGCYDQDGIEALTKYLGYDKSCTLPLFEFHTADEWADMVYDELAGGHPVLYTGSTTRREGHAFVCDGYDGSEGAYFHINWGWSGNYNGFYPLSNLSPEGQGIGGGSGAYTEGNSFFRHLAPDHGGEEGQLYYQVGSIATSTEIIERNGIDPVIIQPKGDSSNFKGVKGYAYFGIYPSNLSLNIRFTDVESNEEIFVPIEFERPIEYATVFNGIPMFGSDFPDQEGDYLVTPGYINNGVWEEIIAEPDVRKKLYCKVKGDYVTFAVDQLASEPNGIADINSVKTSKTRYFNLQGVEIDSPKSGICIRVEDGKSEKIVIQ